MTLADLYPSGTKLVDVPPEFHGMSWKEWNRLKLKNQADKYLAACDAAGPQTEGALRDWKHSKGQEWRGRAIHGPRDDYGSKSL